jgi:hypothetical protein
MKQREQWRPVLKAEMKRWSVMSCAQLAIQLADVRTYEVEFKSKKNQVEVQILENTDSYVHVGIAVDDGPLLARYAPTFVWLYLQERWLRVMVGETSRLHSLMPVTEDIPPVALISGRTATEVRAIARR